VRSGKRSLRPNSPKSSFTRSLRAACAIAASIQSAVGVSNGFARTEPMLDRVLVAARGTRSCRSAMHAEALLPLNAGLNRACQNTGGTLAISGGTQTVELSLLGHYSADNFSIVFRTRCTVLPSPMGLTI
jgi:hypothetical protein